VERQEKLRRARTGGPDRETINSIAIRDRERRYRSTGKKLKTSPKRDFYLGKAVQKPVLFPLNAKEDRKSQFQRDKVTGRKNNSSKRLEIAFEASRRGAAGL